MIQQYLWQVHYQISLMISLKELIKLNENTDTMISNVTHVELKTKTVN